MYKITISNELGSESFEYEEQKSNEVMVEINNCLNSKTNFVTLNNETKEVTYTQDILSKSQISHEKVEQVFFF